MGGWVREEPRDGVEIGFLVELGWTSLIIALGGKGQFALLLFSRMLKFLFLSGPVMYLKHMGTPATICPKSHILSTFLTMCHFDGVQRGGEGEVETAPWELPATLTEGQQRKLQCPRVQRGSVEHRHHLGRERGVRRPCVSQGGEPAWFWLVNFLFV